MADSGAAARVCARPQPGGGLWAHIKRSLANLAARTLSELETLLRRRLKALQYRHSILGGFLAGTGLALDRPDQATCRGRTTTPWTGPARSWSLSGRRRR